MKIKHRGDPIARRVEAYPSLPEQVGALMKAFVALQAGEPIPDDAQAVIDKVKAVKQQFPKGQA